MCPNKIIYRLLDTLHYALPHIHDKDTLQNVIDTLEDIISIMGKGVDE